MLDLSYDYQSCVRNSEQVAWRVDEVMPADARLDFGRPFLPAALSGESELDGLTAEERLQLNHITGHAYLNIFAFVEEYIVVTAVQHAQAEMHGDASAQRALLRFADEEIKHQELFHRFLDAFKRDFEVECEVLGGAVEVAGVIMSKSPLAVMMITLHLEIMTQSHYTESVRKDASIDPLFASLLKHHWLEEAQHARIDALELDKLADMATPAMIDKAFADYLELIDAVDGLLAKQAGMDVESFAKVTGRELDEDEARRITEGQHQAYQNSLLIMGMTHKLFTDVLAKLSPEGARRVAEKAESLRA